MGRARAKGFVQHPILVEFRPFLIVYFPIWLILENRGKIQNRRYRRILFYEKLQYVTRNKRNTLLERL